MTSRKSRVAIIGAGALANPGTSHPEMGFKEMLVHAVYQAIADAKVEPAQIEAASYSYTGESEIGFGGISPTLNDAVALSPIAGFINCSNCASGHTAFMQGCDMVESGRHSIVLVAGFDKSTDVMPFFDYALISSDSMYDYNLGFSHIDAVMMQDAYFSANGISREKREAALTYYAKFARQMGSQHPWAHRYKKRVPSDEDLRKLPLFGSFMQTGEGAAALILASEEVASRFTDKPVFVSGRSYLTTSHYIGHRYDPSLLNGIGDDAVGGPASGLPLALACQAAYREAGMRAQDVDTLGVYDQVTTEFVSIEAAGICGPGEGADFILSGECEIDGTVPLNTDGGNIGRGFAGGTAGLYPLIEIAKQLNGTALGAKINRALKYGLSTYLGGGFAHNVAVVLSNE